MDRETLLKWATVERRQTIADAVRDWVTLSALGQSAEAVRRGLRQAALSNTRRVKNDTIARILSCGSLAKEGRNAEVVVTLAGMFVVYADLAVHLLDSKERRLLRDFYRRTASDEMPTVSSGRVYRTRSEASALASFAGRGLVEMSSAAGGWSIWAYRETFLGWAAAKILVANEATASTCPSRVGAGAAARENTVAPAPPESSEGAAEEDEG